MPPAHSIFHGNKPIYGKQLINDFWLCVGFDSKHLDNNTLATLNGNVSGPTLDMQIALIHRPALSIRMSACKGLVTDIMLFFPIWPGIGFDYKSFFTLREFEGVVKVNMILFSVIQSEIEESLKTVLKDVLLNKPKGSVTN